MSIGETLAAARRDAGLTVADVSAATCVRATIIEGIERDDFSLCGGDFYARGHIRNAARVVGMDPAPLIARYDAEHGSAPVFSAPADVPRPGQSVSVDEDGSMPGLSRRRRGPNWSLAMAVVLLVIIGVAVFRLFTGESQAQRTPAHSGNPGPMAAQTSKVQRSEAHTGKGSADPRPDARQPGHSDGAIRPSNSSGVTLGLHAVDQTWISARGSDGQTIFRANLERGDSTQLSDDKKVVMDIGNAGGVKLTLNGRDIGEVGKPGGVITVAVFPDHVEVLS